MAVVKSSWANAERNCIEYLSKQIEDSEIGRNFFVGEIPPGAYDCWMFAITGPSGTDFLSECTGTTRNMEAVIDGLFLDREEAQQVEQDVRTKLPVTTITNVPRMAQTAEASLAREFIENTDGTAQIRAWRLTIPLMVAFNNVN
ncbi:MAG: hypothetical protein OEQ18_00200 [Gammaproteobacteria bacterium]|nr:hypothetical protein [Gammaproteobacteria bacterium]